MIFEYRLSSSLESQLRANLWRGTDVEHLPRNFSLENLQMRQLYELIERFRWLHYNRYIVVITTKTHHFTMWVQVMTPHTYYYSNDVRIHSLFYVRTGK